MDFFHCTFFSLALEIRILVDLGRGVSARLMTGRESVILDNRGGVDQPPNSTPPPLLHVEEVKKAKAEKSSKTSENHKKNSNIGSENTSEKGIKNKCPTK